MSDSVNIVQLVRGLPLRQRGRSIIILTHDYKNQKVWSADLAQKVGCTHIDLLERFSKDGSLGEVVSQFLVHRLFEFLRGEEYRKILIVSGMEFLMATWSGQVNVVDQFARQVETWNLTPGLVFVLQYDNRLATHDFRRFPQHTFVVNQNETFAL